MNFPGKNTGVGCHFLLQGIFPIQGSNPGLLHCRQILYQLNHQGRLSVCVCVCVCVCVRVCVCVCVLFSCVWLDVTPWTAVHQAFLSMGFSRQEPWSGLPFPAPGDLPDPGIEPTSLASPALAGRFFTTGNILYLGSPDIGISPRVRQEISCQKGTHRKMKQSCNFRT